MVDAQPNAVGSAGCKGSGACCARNHRAGAAPAPRSFASGANASPGAFVLGGRASACASASASSAGRRACSFDAPSAICAACPSYLDSNAGDSASAAGACSLDGSPSDNAAGFAAAAGASARPPAPPTTTEQAPTTPAPAAVATAEPTAPVSAYTPSQLALSNDNGVVRASGVVRDEDAKTSILDALNAVFGADKVKTDISLDKGAAPAPWLGAFRAALDALKNGNVDAIFAGDKVNVGGAALGDAARDTIIAALKNALGASIAVGALTDKTAAAVAIANDKATTELASLGSGFGVKDLLFALNDSVVNFASDSAEVPEAMAPFLKSAASDLKQLKAGNVLEIAGYTDNTGDAALNLALSQKRAEAVREALIKYGADPDMLVAKGYGEADPVATNDTAEGRLKNRRIEYHVVKTPT